MFAFKKKIQEKNMRFIKRSLVITLTPLCVFFISHLCADETPIHGKGFVPATSEQLEIIENTWSRIVGIRPNQIGVERIREHFKKLGMKQPKLQPAEHPEELITVIGKSDALEAMESLPLPISVNNALLNSFPPIGDQQQEGSCVAWASTYYQASHELGLLNGYNNKTSFNHILSPRWTYNLLNGGVDGGLVADTAFSLLAQNGAVSIDSFPYTNGDVTSWDLKQQDWVTAIFNRMAPPHFVTGIGGSAQNLQTIKQLLVNGHVLTFATFIDAWVTTAILQDPTDSNSPYIDQNACTYLNGTEGGHFMTIVGYDDNLWIDVNDNGEVDPGERGAFLVANSWGSSWGNNGFIWISYDAFLDQSAVPGGPSDNRVPAAKGENNYVFSLFPKTANYKPILVAQFTLTQNERDQVAIQGGASAPAVTTPSQTFNCYALQNQGGPFEFNGSQSGSGDTATFAVDLTDLVDPSGVEQNFYLLASDDRNGNPTTLSSYKLLDLANNLEVDYMGGPLQFDNSQISPYILYAAGKKPSVPVVTITAPANNAQLRGTVTLSANASDRAGLERVEFYANNTLLAVVNAAPYQCSLDTKTVDNGMYTLTAVAHNIEGTSVMESINVDVSNGLNLAVNCGCNAIKYGDVDYTTDHNFTSPSYTYYNPTIQDDPLFQTERYGTNFAYNFNAANGNYIITLLFEEIYFRAPNRRVFDVFVNGNQVISQLDLYKTVGYAKPYSVQVPVVVTNGKLRIHFVSSVSNAKISAIQIMPLQ